ncbi:MAG: trigger factor [Clostridia bacterium]|nr:trigger factor [Clostridia bacterium]
MSVKVEKLENNLVKLEITIEAEKFEEGLEKAYFRNAKYFNVPGFRKGKAPRSVVEKHYGESILYEDAFNIIVPDIYEEAIAENNIEAVSHPEIDITQMEKGKDLIFTATVTVKPEVKLGKYKGIKIEKKEYPVTEEEIEKELNEMADKNSRIITGDENTVLEKGNTAVIDFEGFVDDKAFDGGKGENYSLEIGSNTFIPGFEDQLIGLKAGEETDVNVTFPENYFSTELAGKPAVFKVKVNEIKIKELPAIDDEFVKDVSEFDTLDELKADIKKRLEEENAKKAKYEMEEEAIKAVCEKAEVEIPHVMIHNEIDGYIQDMEQRLSYQGMKLETYLQLMGKTLADVESEYHERAEVNVKTKLVLEAIFNAENIEITDKDIEDKIRDIAESYGSAGPNVEELVKNPTDQMKEYVKEELKYDLAVKFIMDNIK